MKKPYPCAPVGGSWYTVGLLALLLALAVPGRAQVFYLTAGSGGSNPGGTTTSDDALTRIDYDGNNPVVIASAITGSPFLLALDGDATRAFVYESVPANRSIKVLNMSTGALIRSFAVNGAVTAMRYDAAADYLYYLTAGPDDAVVEVADALSRVHADGTGTQVLKPSLAAAPQLLVLNVSGGELYFYNNAPGARAINALNFSSYAPTRTTAVTERVTGLEYDQGSNYIYYLTSGVSNAQNAADALARFRPDGSGAAVVASSVTNSPRHLGLDAGNNRAFIYEGQTVSRGIRVISLTSGAQIGNYPVGSDITALATPTVATVVTAAASALTSTSATLGGTVTQTGGAGVTERGVVYSATNTVPAIGSAARLVLGSGTGSFSATASGLTLSTTYYVRAYAISTAGTAYSSVVAFTTTGSVVIWNGSVSTDWFDANNWTGGVPTPTLDARIPAGAPRYPLLTAGLPTAKTLTLDADGQLNQSGATLDLKGAFVINGAYTATGGTVALSGPAAQAVGGAREARFWNLSVGSAGAVLSGLAALQRVLTLGANLSTNGNAFTLLSGPGGTALVVNNGGMVTGMATVQRYIDPILNNKLGYRHYSSPVQSTTVADLITSGFSPVVNTDYNTLGNTVNPFPTVFGFEEARFTNTSATTQGFDYGFFSPGSLGSPLTRGRGYTVNINASEKVDLQGALNTGAVPVGALTRGPEANSGWHLLGNPYPAPLDWKQVRLSLPTGVIEAVYVYKASAQYDGVYQFYQNGFGTLPDGLIGSMQGFFLRVSQNVPSFSFLNSWRTTSYQNPGFNRTTAETRPVVQLDLVSAQGTHEPTYVYFEPGATAGLDDHYDAAKLLNTTGLNLASGAAGTQLAVNGLPLVHTATIVPLTVGVPLTGTYSFQTASLLNLAATDVYLHDALTGQQINLRQQPSYSFSASNAALITGRFSLHFGPLRPTATTHGFTAASVSVYPNPAHGSFTLLVPAVGGASQAQVTLHNVLGQAVRTTTLALPAAGAQTRVDVRNLPVGVYVLRVTAGAATITKRVVVD